MYAAWTIEDYRQSRCKCTLFHQCRSQRSSLRHHPARIRAGSGTVRNTAGVLIIKGNVTTTIHGICDRCATEFSRKIDFPIDAVLVTELSNEENEDEWVFPLVGDSADLDDIVRTVFVLNLDSKLLCKDDCKGLCCRCGKNLNDGPCTCEKEIDPRWAALKQLL